MSQRMRELTIETPNQVFGAELRHWRTLRGLSQTQLGALTRDSGSLIGMIEKADRVASRGLAQRADRALNTGGALESM
ncbi:helix-turn-helix domain-containing protein [Nocardia africana]|uniref:HTH cro/C1-type domain-containing protein n=2 Tax=Nocardia TaxID=1817 RepID=A0A378X7L7_9NOCA|nr:helix-turn-helix transcriptional regulator [Nocardia africana]MCC3317887.1 helix-turn-helix transcriptional regulator [Nocardia africana]SUA48661.1 Uncharacterised protein [Nocardia africana]